MRTHDTHLPTSTVARRGESPTSTHVHNGSAKRDSRRTITLGPKTGHGITKTGTDLPGGFIVTVSHVSSQPKGDDNGRALASNLNVRIPMADPVRPEQHLFPQPAGPLPAWRVDNTLLAASSNRLESITTLLRAQGVAEDIIDLAKRPQRVTTSNTYSGQWGKFVNFCRIHNRKPFEVSESGIAEYLLHLFRKDNMPSSIKVH